MPLHCSRTLGSVGNVGALKCGALDFRRRLFKNGELCPYIVPELWGALAMSGLWKCGAVPLPSAFSAQSPLFLPSLFRDRMSLFLWWLEKWGENIQASKIRLICCKGSIDIAWIGLFSLIGFCKMGISTNHPENQALSSSESVLTTLPSPMGMGSVGERSELSTLSNLLADFLHDH